MRGLQYTSPTLLNSERSSLCSRTSNLQEKHHAKKSRNRGACHFHHRHLHPLPWNVDDRPGSRTCRLCLWPRSIDGNRGDRDRYLPHFLSPLLWATGGLAAVSDEMAKSTGSAGAEGASTFMALPWILVAIQIGALVLLIKSNKKKLVVAGE